MDGLVALAVWAAGTIPATFIAARREPYWADEGITTELAATLAVTFWPIWLFIVVVLKPICFVCERFYSAIWNAAKKDDAGG